MNTIKIVSNDVGITILFLRNGVVQDVKDAPRVTATWAARISKWVLQTT